MSLSEVGVLLEDFWGNEYLNKSHKF